MATLLQVVSGSVTLGSGVTSIDATIDPALSDLSKAFLVFSTRRGSNQPQNGLISGKIVDSDTITFQRWSTTGAADIVIDWFVPEFSTGVNVQRGSVSLTANPTDVNITAVDLSKSIILTTFRQAGSAFDQDDSVRQYFLDSDTIRFDGQSTQGSSSFEWQVIEFTDNTVVLSGTAQIANGSTSTAATLPSTVDTNKTWVLFTHRSPTGTGTNIGQKMVTANLVDGDTISFARSNTGSTIDIAWFAVVFDDNTIVQRGNNTLTGTNTTADTNITAVDLSKSIGYVGGHAHTRGSTTLSTDDDTTPATASIRFLDNDTVRIERNGSVSADASFYWQVIEFLGESGSLVEYTITTNVAGDPIWHKVPERSLNTAIEINDNRQRLINRTYRNDVEINDFRARSIIRSFTNNVATIATQLKQPIRLISNSVSGAVSLLRTLNKFIDNVISGSVEYSRLFMREITETVSLNDTINKRAERSLNTTIDIVTTLTKRPHKSLENAVQIVTDITKTPSKVISAVVGSISEISRMISREIIITINTLANYTKSIARSITNAVNGIVDIATEIINNFYQYTINVGVGVSDSVIRFPHKIITQLINTTDTYRRNLTTTITTFISVVQSAIKTPERQLSNNVGVRIDFNRVIDKIINNVVAGVVNNVKEISRTINNTINTTTTINKLYQYIINIVVGITYSISSIANATIVQALRVKRSITNMNVTQRIVSFITRQRTKRW